MLKSNPKKLFLLALCSVVLGTVIALSWQNYRAPLVGGSRPDGFFARWAKKRAYAIVPPAEDRAAARLTPENANGWFNLGAEPVQSLALYQSQNPTRPTPTRRTLILQPIGAMNAEDKALLQDCKVYCEAFFALPTRIAPPLMLDKTRFSPRLGKVGSALQLNASALLENALSPRLPADAAAYLGLTSDDLWTDGLSFVFGQASLENRVGIYSVARYFPRKRPQKLTPIQRRVALRRTIQVLVHEAGHMFGLTHCVLYKCAMNGSNSLADADATPLNYCPICTRKLAWNFGFNPTERDAKLRLLNRRFGLEN